jgi:hypothetical protein
MLPVTKSPPPILCCSRQLSEEKEEVESVDSPLSSRFRFQIREIALRAGSLLPTTITLKSEAFFLTCCKNWRQSGHKLLYVL